MDLFRFIPGYTDAVYHEGKEPLLLLIVAFVVCFSLTRAYTRIARRAAGAALTSATSTCITSSRESCSSSSPG